MCTGLSGQSGVAFWILPAAGASTAFAVELVLGAWAADGQAPGPLAQLKTGWTSVDKVLNLIV